MQERIQLLIKSYGLNPTQFADEIGAQRSSISHILSGRNNPSLDIVLKILNRFKEIDTDWLVLGKGSMFSKLGEKNSQDANNESSEALKGTKNSFSNTLFDEVQDNTSNKKDLDKIQDLEMKIALLEKQSRDKDTLIREIETKTPEIKEIKTENIINNVEPQVETKKLEAENHAKEENNPSLTPISQISNRHITKLVVFYSDNTFEELTKN